MDLGTLKALLLQQMSQPKALYAYAEAMQWCIQVAEGLDFMHNNSPTVLHRDMKCDNVLLKLEGGQRVAKIGDLGLHALIHPAARERNSRNSSVAAEREDSSSAAASLKPIKHSRYHTAPLAEGPGTDQVPREAYKMTGQTGAYTYMAPGEPVQNTEIALRLQPMARVPALHGIHQSHHIASPDVITAPCAQRCCLASLTTSRWTFFRWESSYLRCFRDACWPLT